MIQYNLFPAIAEGEVKSYEHVKPIVIDLRRSNPGFSSEAIVGELKALGVSPMPKANTITRWCRDAGLPILRALSFSQYPDELKERILKLLESGMTKPGVRELLESEGEDVPPINWINKMWRAHRKSGLVLLKNADPARQVEHLLHEGIIGINEAWDALTERGMDEDKALDWVMDRFIGGAGKIANESSGSGKVFSIAQRRWAA